MTPLLAGLDSRCCRSRSRSPRAAVRLWAIGGVRAGKLAVVSQMTGDSRWPLAARGTKIAVYTEGGLAVYDTNKPAPTLVKSVELRGWAYSSHVLLGEDRAVCSLGEWGLQTLQY